MEIESEIRRFAPILSEKIIEAARCSLNEAEFRTHFARYIDDFAEKAGLELHLNEEYTLVDGRADAVYNRLIIEYEPPHSLREKNEYRNNQHGIGQVKTYIDGIVRRERHRAERLAGVIIDGGFFIFIRKKDEIWTVDPAQKVTSSSCEYFLKLLSSLSTELALIPENLARDFGENTITSRKVVSTFYHALHRATNIRVNKLYEQWSFQFSEVCDYDDASKMDVHSFAEKYGITERDLNPFDFFFCLHTYYATFIKLLAVQVVFYYLTPKIGTDLKKATNLGSEELRKYLSRIEEGGIFRDLGIMNFIEGDFFSWYLDIWDDDLYQSLLKIISTLANYSLVTLDVDPDVTRDLLKKLYQQLMPRELRHNLGEYYTPDWLAERLLNMLDAGKFKGDLRKRLLDPACGSGTFLVLAIKKVKENAWKNAIPESEVLEKIISNIFGFDLNPLAVISARTNYLLALGDLLAHKTGDIHIPVYLCDSILTLQEGQGLYDHGTVRFSTAVGIFTLPRSLIQAQYIDQLSNFLEESVKLNLSIEQFVQKLCNTFPLLLDKDKNDIQLVYKIYEQLLSLEQQGVNGVWARIIKNAFAPLFAGQFDFIAGNPPWVNWESLPEEYRQSIKPIWVKYGLFPHGGMDTILGKGKKDISTLMTYVAIDKYLKPTGKLGFLITQSVFKTSGAGQGFRRFQIGNNGIPIQVIHVDDMTELNPFEGASNRTAIIILQKGRPTAYPMKSYQYWKKTAIGRAIPLEATLDEVLKMTERKYYIAVPVDSNDLTSSWLTGRPKALEAIKKVLGKSDYVAHEGCNTGGANAIYWMEILDQRNDGTDLVANITDGAKKKVENIQTVIESDLLYPLLRGRDVQRWKAEPSAYILMVQDPVQRRGTDENIMKTKYPKTYLYLKRFENELRDRAAFKRYFTRKDKHNRIVDSGLFYSMFNIGDYTFAPYKVVWTRLSSIEAAVVKDINRKVLIPQETNSMIDTNNLDEAFFLCSMINSSIFQFAAISYSQEGGKSMGSPQVLEYIRIPKFNKLNTSHQAISLLSQKAHEVTKTGDHDALTSIEAEIDELAAKIWGLNPEELKEIQLSLKEIME